jgi:NAD(P)-dependent dehydrogenase (short-subunit alcohol dehydrogenase family)
VSFDGPVLVITGGAQGIGRSIVLLAALRGYRVAFTYRSNHPEAESTVAQAQALGGEALAIAADVGDQVAMQAAFGQIVECFGRIDGLVNNAGIVGAPRPIVDAQAEHLEEVFRTNVLGVFYSTAAAVGYMSSQRGGNGGAIVNMSSAATRHGGMINEAHYAASKGAIDGLTLALAKELPPHGIRINALRPGVIRTSIHEIHGGEALISRVEPTIPLGRAGTSDEVAKVALFLLSSESAYMHGTIIDVSGGR